MKAVGCWMTARSQVQFQLLGLYFRYADDRRLCFSKTGFFESHSKATGRSAQADEVLSIEKTQHRDSKCMRNVLIMNCDGKLPSQGSRP